MKTLALICIAAMAVVEIAHAAPPASETASTSPERLPSPTATDAGSTDSSSRYRWHEGRWWYLLPTNQWVWWDGQTWRESAPQANQYQQYAPPRGRGYAALSIGPIGQLEPYNWPWRGGVNPSGGGWVGGFYSSGGGYGSSDFGYGYGVPTYGPYRRGQ